MADAKMTEVQALTLAIEMFKRHEYGANETFMSEVEGVPAVEKLEHMLKIRSKKRERKSDNSKTLANIALGEQFAAAWGDKGNFRASDLKEVLDVSTAKASAICRAMKWPTVPTTEKVNVYTLD